MRYQKKLKLQMDKDNSSNESASCQSCEIAQPIFSIGHGVSVNIELMVVFDSALPNDESLTYKIIRRPGSQSHLHKSRFSSQIFPNCLERATPQNQENINILGYTWFMSNGKVMPSFE